MCEFGRGTAAKASVSRWRLVGVFVLVALPCCYHSPHKTAAVSVLIRPVDDASPVPCTLKLTPTTADPSWHWESPPTLQSRGLTMWWPEMGLLESWPTEFRANLACEGYRPWTGLIRSESSFRPKLTIDVVIERQ
jgi:hypothetical protein